MIAFAAIVAIAIIYPAAMVAQWMREIRSRGFFPQDEAGRW